MSAKGKAGDQREGESGEGEVVEEDEGIMERRKATLDCTLNLGGRGEQMSLTVQEWILLSLLQQQPDMSNPPCSLKTKAC